MSYGRQGAEAPALILPPDVSPQALPAGGYPQTANRHWQGCGCDAASDLSGPRGPMKGYEMNEITITGNLVNAPVMRDAGAQRVTKFRIAHNHSYRDASTGDWVDAGATFIDVSCWRNLAENVAESIGKGSAVIVTGRLRGKERTTEVDGRQERRTYFEIEASAIGPDLSRGATQAVDIKRKSVQQQEDRAVEEASALATGEASASPVSMEAYPAA